MALEIKLQQKLSQSLVMTPQLQQAIKLLQLGHQEYVEVVERELLENPALEESSDDEGDGNADERSSIESESDHTEISFCDSTEESEFKIRKEERSEEFEFNGLYYETVRRGSGPDDSVSALESTISAPKGLSSHLMWQLNSIELTDKQKEIAIHILGNLDQNGFLIISLAEVAHFSYSDEDEAEEVLTKIQMLDPLGVGARDLRECLLIQLEAYGKKGALPYVIVDRFLSEVELRNYASIAKAEGVSIEDVYEAIKEIQKLEPRPARNFSVDPPQYISPDVYIKRVGSDYVISLNDSGLPKIQLNANYHNLIKAGGALKGADKEYLSEKVKAAQWLIKSIQQRQQTIYRVTESIMRFQKDFLEIGIAGLKPLVLREVASEVELHESTISRVTSNKYVHTPHGIFELKFFFSSSISSGKGDMSSEAVKERISDMVKIENPKKPFSDQQIVLALKSEGIEIARRTVAKYREMLGILSSSRRKKLF